jgi:hypothetical protein
MLHVALSPATLPVRTLFFSGKPFCKGLLAGQIVPPGTLPRGLGSLPAAAEALLTGGRAGIVGEFSVCSTGNPAFGVREPATGFARLALPKWGSSLRKASIGKMSRELPDDTRELPDGSGLSCTAYDVREISKNIQLEPPERGTCLKLRAIAQEQVAGQ